MSFKKVVTVGILLGTFVLTGCASITGSPQVTDDYLRQNLVVGQSTEADVRKLLGEPDYQNNAGSNAEGNDYWSYSLDKHHSSMLGRLSSVAGFIPGVGVAASYASLASSQADTASSIANSGQVKSQELNIYFQHGVLRSYGVTKRKMD